jgi:hypothetical protein
MLGIEHAEDRRAAPCDCRIEGTDSPQLIPQSAQLRVVTEQHRLELIAEDPL